MDKVLCTELASLSEGYHHTSSFIIICDRV